MQLLIMFMPRHRKAVSYRIDSIAIDALGKLAKKENMSANRYLENLLFSVGLQKGVIPKGTEPLGETRGGERKVSGNEEDEDEG
ncbi:hypothetical protein [Nostoc sp.]